MALIRLLGEIGSQQSTTEQPCYSPGRLLIVHRNVRLWCCCSEESIVVARGRVGFASGPQETS